MPDDVSRHDHDLLIEIKTMLQVALEQLKGQAVQLTGLTDRVGKLESRIGAVETGGQVRDRLPNWVPTASMITSVVVAVIAVVAALRP